MGNNRVVVSIVLAVLAIALAGCTIRTEAVAEPLPADPSATARSTTAESAPSTAATSAPSSPRPSGPTGDASATSTPPKPAATPSEARSGKPARATVSIPAMGLESLPVIGYLGSPDDRPGTEIQNGGVAASPGGPGGGVGPGEVGNYIITAHRTSAGAPFGELPSVRKGAHILVRSQGKVYDYVVTRTRKTSFRSERSLAAQSAPVPGHPGREPTRPMITLSTCATPEDRAAGNYWSDEFGNPEHRIDKVGVLVDVRSR